MIGLARQMANRAEIAAIALRGTARQIRIALAAPTAAAEIVAADRREAAGALTRLWDSIPPGHQGSQGQDKNEDARKAARQARLCAQTENTLEPEELDRWAQEWDEWALATDPGVPPGSARRPLTLDDLRAHQAFLESNLEQLRARLEPKNAQIRELAAEVDRLRGARLRDLEAKVGSLTVEEEAELTALRAVLFVEPAGTGAGVEKGLTLHVFIARGIAGAPPDELGAHITTDPTDAPKPIPLSWSLSFAPVESWPAVLCHVHFDGDMPSEHKRDLLRDGAIVPAIQVFLSDLAGATEEEANG